jgi:hypothetical protein
MSLLSRSRPLLGLCRCMSSCRSIPTLIYYHKVATITLFNNNTFSRQLGVVGSPVTLYNYSRSVTTLSFNRPTLLINIQSQRVFFKRGSSTNTTSGVPCLNSDIPPPQAPPLHTCRGGRGRSENKTPFPVISYPNAQTYKKDISLNPY